MLQGVELSPGGVLVLEGVLDEGHPAVHEAVEAGGCQGLQLKLHLVPPGGDDALDLVAGQEASAIGTVLQGLGEGGEQLGP